MRPVGLKQQSKQIESYCDSRQQRRQRQTQKPSQLQSNLFHRQVICLQKQMFCNLLTRKFLCVFCVFLALFAVARFVRRPPPDTCLHCLCCCFVCCLHVIGYLSVSVAAPVLVCFPLSLFLFLSGSCFANENCTRMLPK